MMKRILFAGIILASAALNVFGQAASATWALTSAVTSVVTGKVTATDQSVSNLTYSEYKTTYQRRAGSTKTLQTVYDATYYVQYAVAPVSGYTLTVSSISMKIFCDGTSSNGRAAVYYSTNSDFSSPTAIYSSASPLTLTSSLPSSANINCTSTINVPDGQTLYVRVYPWLAASGTTKYLASASVVISGTTVPTVGFTTSVSQLINFVQQSSAVPSSTQSFTLSGAGLTDSVTITPPANFEVSPDSAAWYGNTSPIKLDTSSGAIKNQPVKLYARLNASSAGYCSDTIRITSTGASSALVAVNGVQLSAEPTTVSTVTFDSVGGSSMRIGFTGGNGGRRVVVLRAGSAVTWTPTDGVASNGVSSDFITAADKGNGNKIVYDGADTDVAVTGLSSNVTYYAAVYEYNAATGNSQNYLTASAGTGNQTTPAVSTLTLTKTSLSFGTVVTNTTSGELSYAVSGVYLSPAADTIVVTAPAGFEVSLTSGSGYSSLLKIYYSANTLPATTIYVHFLPTALAASNGVITDTGGSAPAMSLTVSGTGVSQLFATNAPVGYASCGTGTTGGAGGDTVVITDSGTLNTLLTARQKYVTTPVVYMISGTLTSPGNEIDVKRTSNISILGIGSDAVINGFGFKLTDATNIVFRNITFTDCTAGEGDAISIESSTNVWVDHNYFTDAPGDSSNEDHDGQTDTKKGSVNVTVSYNHYTHHRKTCLLGYTASDYSDTATGITYYHNWFERTYSRTPRVRHAHPHVLNNYFDECGMWGADSGGYAIGATCGCLIYSEANYFEHVRTPFLISMYNDPEGVLSHDPVGYLKSVNDYFVNCFGTVTTHDTTAMILPSDHYSYTAEDPMTVKATVIANAGPGILDIKAPTVTSVASLSASIPAQMSLKQNYPNPFNPATLIMFTVAKTGYATVKVYDMIGREVATLFNGLASTGRDYTLSFDASRLSSGIYFYRLISAGKVETRKMVLMK
jgi:pectate lyase